MSADSAKSDDGGGFPDMLLTSTGSGEEMFGIPDIVVDLCSVVAKDDFTAIRVQMTRLLGAEPMESPESLIWIYARDGAAIRSEAALADLDLSEMPTLVRERRLFFATLSRDEEGVTSVSTMAIRPTD